MTPTRLQRADKAIVSPSSAHAPGRRPKRPRERSSPTRSHSDKSSTAGRAASTSRALKPSSASGGARYPRTMTKLSVTGFERPTALLAPRTAL
jgi:hypothetical protein